MKLLGDVRSKLACQADACFIHLNVASCKVINLVFAILQDIFLERVWSSHHLALFVKANL